MKHRKTGKEELDKGESEMERIAATVWRDSEKSLTQRNV